MKRYSPIRGHARLAAITAAIERGGGLVSRASSPTTAPFEISVTLPRGKHLELICYAFAARAYEKRDGSGIEHRVQVRYGRDSRRPQWLYLDEARRRVTLFFGIHFEKNLFIAVDPAAHDPTWFPSSIEASDEDIELAAKTGWHGWERDRGAEGRRKIHHLENLCTEVVLAFHPQYFLTYAHFEGCASGLDAGERLLLIDKIEEEIH